MAKLGKNAPDAGQAVIEAFDQTYRVFNVRDLAGSLVPDIYDQISFTYVLSGNGVGDIATETYKLQNLQIAVLTYTYDAQNRIIDVART